MEDVANLHVMIAVDTPKHVILNLGQVPFLYLIPLDIDSEEEEEELEIEYPF